MPEIAATVYLILGFAVLFWTLSLTRSRLFGRFLRPLAGILAMGPALGLPLLLTAGVLVLAAVAALGGLGPRAGLLGLALHGAAWLELALYAAELRQARPRLDGEPVDDVAPVLGWARPLALRWSSWLTWAVPGEVKIRRGLQYREVDGVRLRLDVYQPTTPSEPRPPVIYVHGGAWIGGTRLHGRTFGRSLAREGWTVFAVSYRLAPRFPLPAAVHDVKAAVAWVRAHAADFGVLDAPPLMAGGSAGGHLVALAAATPNQPELQPGFEAADTRVAGAAIWYGVTDLEWAFEAHPHAATAWFLERFVLRRRRAEAPDLFAALNPIKQAALPSLLVIHGDRDDLVSPRLSARFVRTLRERGAPTIHLVEVPAATHGFDVVPSPLQQRTSRVVLGFFAQLRGAG